MKYLGSVKLTTTKDQNLMEIIKGAEHAAHPEFKLDNPKTGLVIRELSILADSECEIIINKDNVILSQKTKKFKLPIKYLVAKTAGVKLSIDYAYGDEYEFDDEHFCVTDFPNGGSSGDTGATGPQGIPGPQGEVGPQGIPGPQGIQGERGPQGADGVKGETGATGPQGPSGSGGGSGSVDLSDYYNKGEVDGKLTYSNAETKLVTISMVDIVGTEYINPTKTVDVNGDVGTSGNPHWGLGNGFILPKDVDEMVFTVAEDEYDVIISANDDLTQSIFLSIGSNFREAEFMILKGSQYTNKDYIREYTREELNSSYPYSRIVLGDDIKVVNGEDRVTFYFKKPNSQDFVKWFHTLKSDIPCTAPEVTELGVNGLGNKRLGLLRRGIGNSPNIIGKNVRMGKTIGKNQTIREKIVELDTTVKSLESEAKTHNKKCAIVCVAGGSEAVGCDESPVEHRFTYIENSRVKQLGFKGDDNLKIIPLTHCAQNFEDMTEFTNPASPNRKGTKGIHLPLGNLLAKQIPDDYDIVIIPCAYGDTGFTKGSPGGYIEATMKPNNGSVPKDIKWGETSPYLLTMIDRIKFVLDKNEDSIFLGVVWMQGEGDYRNHTFHQIDFIGMTTLFFNSFNTGGYSNRVRKGIFDKDIWFNVETVNYWYTQGTARYIWDNYKTWNDKTYVEVPRDTDSNEVNGTGATSPIKASHFGNNAFYNVVAPNVFNKMLSANVLL